MNFDDIKLMWEKDSKIDDTELDTESLKIPQLHSKYLNLYSDYILIKEKTESEQKLIIRQLWEYYSGKTDEPFDIKLLKQDIPMYIEADEKYQKITNKLKYYTVITNFLKEVLSNINARSYTIKNTIEWRKFLNGI
jgi:Recombination, repair and ssDNA binding protein UvsY